MVWEEESRAVTSFTTSLTRPQPFFCCICVSLSQESWEEEKEEPRLYLEELHPDAGEHELKQCGDDHDVPDGPDGDEHALNHML